MHFRFAIAAPLMYLALSAPTTWDSVRLAWKLEAGDVLRYRITQEMQQTTMDMETATSSTIVMSQKVVSVGADGVADVEVTYDAMKMHMEVPMLGDMDYDSTLTGDEAKKNDERLSALGKLVGSSFHMQLEPSGRIAELSGIGELLAKAFPESASADPMLGSIQEMFKQSFGDDAIKKLVEVAVFPDKALTIGEKWNRTTSWDLPMIGTLDIAMELTFEGLEPQKGEECARIAIANKVTQDKSKGPVANPFAEQFDVDVSVSDSSGKGTLYFAPESGRMVKQIVDQTMEMGMDIRPKDSDESAPPAMQVEVSIEVRQTIELLGKDEPLF